MNQENNNENNIEKNLENKEESVVVDNITEEVKVDESPVEEMKVDEKPIEETQVEQTNPSEPVMTKTIDYLDNSIIFDMKTVDIKDMSELSSSDSEPAIDTSMYDHNIIDIKQNRIVSGRVVDITDKGIFVDIGFKSEGMVMKDEFSEIPDINDEIKVYIKSFEDSKGNFVLSKQKADFEVKWQELRETFEDDGLVQGKIIKRIKGGMIVELGGVQGFLPGSQIEVYTVADFDKYIDLECDFKIVKFNEIRRNIVLSRKELLNDEMKEKRQEILSQMEVGMILEGIVKNVTEFGAFVDLGGIDGLLHITDITWGRINHPSEKISLGEKIKVKVIDFDVKNIKISLGMKQLEENPWSTIESKYSEGTKVKGKVVNLMNYGLFLELEEGIEGLIHISEMSWTKHIKHPKDIYQINDEVEAVVISLDIAEKKIALGIKQLLEDPWESIENKYPANTNHKGTVKHFTQYGAFVELEEGVDGLLHISDMSWTTIVKHPSEILSLNDEIEVKILEVSSEERKLGVGLKQLQEDPLNAYKPGDSVSAKVVKVLDKGIIFLTNESIEGMISFNDLSDSEKDSLKDQYKLDEEYNLSVSEVNNSMKKIFFSSKNIETDKD
ncbi:MAG: 30S ribosomal protein S1 [Candidatus Marinimicrobia bacterium]|nr:30S ribosomal protein S1 [Candidatus Neomarinimicrobiota bacterium]|tara:strand:+ start:2692 stop:4524 length:1833 start_codon:yes stop_codon:yes gene_type:complete